MGGGNSGGGASYSFGVKGLLHGTIGDGEGNPTVSASILDWHLDAPSGLIQGAVSELKSYIPENLGLTTR